MPASTPQRPWEFNSARDYNGHGTHTASTAGGNHGVPATGPGGRRSAAISGMAPRARIAVYKALWSTQDASTASGFTSDLVAAIDQAVADGVDVINYSISGTLDQLPRSRSRCPSCSRPMPASSSPLRPATAARPRRTVAHPGPVAHHRRGRHAQPQRRGLGDPRQRRHLRRRVGRDRVGPAPLIDSTAAGLAGADPNSVALCFAAADNLAVQRRAGSGQGRRQDRGLRSRRQRPGQQEPGRRRKPAASA